MLGNDFRYGYAPTRDTTVIGSYLGRDMSAVNFPSYSLSMGTGSGTTTEKEREGGLKRAVSSALTAGESIADTVRAFYESEAQKARTQTELAQLEREKALARQGINPFTGRPITAGQISTVAVVGGVAALGIVLVLMSQRRRRRRR